MSEIGVFLQNLWQQLLRRRRTNDVVTAQASAPVSEAPHGETIVAFRASQQEIRRQLARDAQRLQMLRSKTEVARRGK